MRTSRHVVHESHYHVVWATKYRRPLIDDEIEVRVKQVIDDLAQEKDVIIEAIECMPDHVHILADIHPQYGVGEFVKNAKGRTARAIRSEFPWVRSKAPSLWTHSYFVATAGGDPLDAIREYVESQKLRGE